MPVRVIGNRCIQPTRPPGSGRRFNPVHDFKARAFGRKPSADDLKAALDHVAKNEKTKRVAYENILWALLNTKEFVFNQ